jgi:hypothetical protein
MAESLAIPLAQLWNSLVLGLVVGLTEFLPISSSAHLAVVPVWLGWSDPGLAMSAVIELGSSGAVIAYFRRDLVRIARALRQAWKQGDWSAPDARLGLAMALGTVPLLLVGAAVKLLAPELAHGTLRSFQAIGVVSILMAALLGLAEWIGRRRRSLAELRVSDGVLVGLAQALAVIPGREGRGDQLLVHDRGAAGLPETPLHLDLRGLQAGVRDLAAQPPLGLRQGPGGFFATGGSAPRGRRPMWGRLSTGCGGQLLTPGTADRVSFVHAWPALCLTGEEWGSRLWEEMLGA